MKRWKWAIFGVAIAGIVLFLRSGMNIDTMVEIPEAESGEVLDATGWLAIHLTANGQVYCKDEQVSIAELRERLLDEPDATILLCADRRASFLNTQYIASTLMSPARKIYLAVRTGWHDAVLPYTCDDIDITRGVVAMLVSTGNGFESQGVRPAKDCRFHLIPSGKNKSAQATDHREAIAGLVESERKSAAVFGSSDAPMEAVVSALDVFAQEGHIPAIGTVTPHPWVARQRTLRAPAWRTMIDPVTLVKSATERFHRSARVALPFTASLQMVSDRTSHAVLIEMDGRGKLMYRDQWIDEVDLRKLLSEVASDIPSFAMAAKLRIDKDAPWAAVRGLLLWLEQEDVNSYGLAVSLAPDASHAPADLASFGILPSSAIPRPPSPGEAVVHIPGLEPKKPLSGAIDVKATSAGIAIGDKDPVPAFKAEFSGSILRIVCDGAMRWQEVLAVVNRVTLSFPDVVVFARSVR